MTRGAEPRVERVPRALATLAFVLLGYGLVVVFLSWPLARSMASELPWTMAASLIDGFVEEMALADEMPTPAAVSALVAKTGVRYVWVRIDEMPPGKRAMWKVAEATGFGGTKVVAREGNQVLFTVSAGAGR